MAVRNIARGGGAAFKPQILGLKELERKLKALRADNPNMTKDMYQVVGDAADSMRDEMRASASAAGWGSQKLKWRSGQRSGIATGNEAIQSIFSFSKPRGGDSRKRISAVVGVGKRRTLVEWIAGRFPKSPRAKVSPGGRVAMALAAMLEFGTTRRAARPAIRKAIQSGKMRIVNTIAVGYRTLLAKYSK